MSDGGSLKRIVLPTDLAEGCQQVWSHAVHLALRNRARLDLIHVRREGDDPPHWERLPSLRQMLVRWGVMAPSAELADFQALGVAMHSHELHGDSPADLVSAMVDRLDPQLLVVGTKQRQGLQRLVRGSVAERIALRTGVGTFFMGIGTTGWVDSETGTDDLSRVLVPVGPDLSAQLALDAAVAQVPLLTGGQVELTLLTVGRGPVPAELELPPGPQLKVRITHRSGDVVEQILAEAREHEMRLILMGTHGHDGLLDSLRGSRTEQVIRQAPCPVLAVPIL